MRHAINVFSLVDIHKITLYYLFKCLYPYRV